MMFDSSKGRRMMRREQNSVEQEMKHKFYQINSVQICDAVVAPSNDRVLVLRVYVVCYRIVVLCMWLILYTWTISCRLQAKLCATIWHSNQSNGSLLKIEKQRQNDSATHTHTFVMNIYTLYYYVLLCMSKARARAALVLIENRWFAGKTEQPNEKTHTQTQTQISRI